MWTPNVKEASRGCAHTQSGTREHGKERLKKKGDGETERSDMGFETS